MSSIRRSIHAAVALGGALSIAWSQGGMSSPHSQTQDRTRTVLSKSLSTPDGEHLKAVLVEVRYGPGEASLPHSHPCAVIAYVVGGTIRTHVKGEPEMNYRAGESFYEAPNGVHLVSANASSTEAAKFIAYFICDRDTPLSVPASRTTTEGEK